MPEYIIEVLQQVYEVKVEQPETRVVEVAGGATGPQGPQGPPGEASSGIVDANTYDAPTLLANSAEIPAPATQRERRFIQGAGGARSGITIAAGTGTRELVLVGTDNSNTAQLISSANVQLSGPWVARQGSVLGLHWTAGLNKYLEAFRNEI